MNEIEIYILDKTTLKIKQITKTKDYSINIDEETNAKSEIKIKYDVVINKKDYIVIKKLLKNDLYMVVDSVTKEKKENIAKITAMDISNIFNRKIIEEDTSIIFSTGLEDYIAKNIDLYFTKEDYPYLKVTVKTHTKKWENTEANKKIYNFHTFITNCRQNKDVYMDYKITTNTIKNTFEIVIENRANTNVEMVDTTVAEIIDFKNVSEIEVVSKVTSLITADNSRYSLYLRNDRTTTDNPKDPNIFTGGNIECISSESLEKAKEETLNVFKSNRYKHLLEFKLNKKSKLFKIDKLLVGTKIKIKTKEKILDSYISAIKMNNSEVIEYKTGNIRVNLIDKLKKEMK